MFGLSTDIISHRLLTNPACPLVKQKIRKFKPNLSLRIKDEVTKKIEANTVRVTNYLTWLANIVPVLKKDEKIRISVDYRDLNKDSPKDIFSLLNFHILIDNCAKHELQSFFDCFAGYYQILMDENDAEKISFSTLFHNMIHKEIEVYMDDVVIKSKKSSDHLDNLQKFFKRLQRYDLKFNPTKCAFGVPTESYWDLLLVGEV